MTNCIVKTVPWVNDCQSKRSLIPGCVALEPIRLTQMYTRQADLHQWQHK